MSNSDIFPTYRPPDWYPLQRALALVFGTAAIDATASFWFIGFVQGPADVGELRLYEYSTTRRRIALDRNGGAYGWFDEINGYSRVDHEEALIGALV
ncbi:hypothetical protein [Gemmatimonas groenlandica]|uniref:Uncharacterized protein n=1 Tax=Gemmatimonas groenlandica TaxID=2732249 RepID=A0A6M4IQV8_9BACT|nr:hypothetical protein [Gemmatimonas groenlandica]QJR34641.1 hypothetical protein HKW67_03465 [Gemmatimonas groenlandica]